MGCAVLIAATSCSKKGVPLASGEVEVIIPCSGPDYSTNKKHIRASGMGMSGDMNMAKKKAMAEATSALASTLNTLVERVATNYASSYQMGEAEESKQKYEDMAKLVVKEKLTGIRTICEKITRANDGKYRAYIVLELECEELLRGIHNSMSKGMTGENKVRIDYEYEKYKQEFDKEMERLEKQGY